MSVILYEEEKFLRIYQSLKLMGRDIAHLFGYPKGWNEPGGMDGVIKSFVADLRRANITTWNRQYPDDPTSLAVPDFDQGILPYGSDFELTKSLKGLHYNLISNDGQETNLLGCCERLHNLIYYIMSTIIDRLPLYQKLIPGERTNINIIHNGGGQQMTKKFYYKVTGIDRINNDLYRLGYTGHIEKCSEFYVEGGWKRGDLVFERKGMGGK